MYISLGSGRPSDHSTWGPNAFCWDLFCSHCLSSPPHSSQAWYSFCTAPKAREETHTLHPCQIPAGSMTLIEKLVSFAKWEIVVNIACFAFFCRAAPAHAYTDSNETGKFSHSNCSAGLSNVLQPGCKKPYKIALGIYIFIYILHFFEIVPKVFTLYRLLFIFISSVTDWA